jgi:16S rRNA (uracil1498-N3)-methyltransferase
MQLFYQPRISEGLQFLDPDESRHCLKVLRKKPGDTIDVTDGKGSIFKARITNSDPRKCQLEIEGRKIVNAPDHYIHIGIAPTKNMDRMEWLVEKCTEIGVDEISFFVSSNSERKVLKNDRLSKKMISAMKQSIKARLPKLNELISFTSFIESVNPDVNKYIAFVDPENPISLMNAAVKKQKYCVLIGPEGDFTKEELDLAQSKRFKKVNLGTSRLRTETAGIVACHTLKLINSQN